tara:strand:+ start:2370 stop:3962 length:1593 start_codon:yes stop_codon:yes gene_type:complete
MKNLSTVIFAALFLARGLLAHDPASDMASAATRFLESLGSKEKEKTFFPFGSDERENWHFFPGSFVKPDGRKGLSIKEMSPSQKILAHGLLGSALSHRGLLEASEVMLLEQILYEKEGRAIRDVELYHVAIFGLPDKAGTWGWRFEGHHLSLNFSFLNGRIFSVTPSFFGASPAKVSEGKHAGMRVLSAEEDKARKLVRSLNSPQRKMAILSEKPPREILSGQDNVVDRKSFFPPQGLPITKMNPRQRGWLEEVIHAYSAKHRSEVIEQVAGRKPLLHPEQTFFVWSGGVQEGEPHYYRIQTADFLFEYANTQNSVNHVHAVWRDFKGDFGRDLLAEHYRNDHPTQSGWVSMFDGKSLKGWKANENQESFWVKDGCIVTNAPGRCHLFYETEKPFRNFEFKAQIMTLPHSNAGVYFHTSFQDEGWPKVGFECQVNNTYHDPKKTASLYGVVDCLDAPAKDDEWFELYIKVDGKRVITKVNDKTIVDWTQPSDWKKGESFERILNEGTFALQGHDPGSTVLFRNLLVKRLP